MKKIFLSITALFMFGLNSFAQTAPTLETILSEAQKQSENYRQIFRDLLAEETKTFTEFDRAGNIDKKVVVRSNFLVYQAEKDTTKTVELRNVYEVDGKIVPDGQKRSDEFLAELEKEKTLESRLKKIQKESGRFDKTWEIDGLTINEAVTIQPRLQPSFEYKLLGTENINGNEVYILGYQQTKQTPYVTVNGKGATSDAANDFQVDIPGSLKKNDKFLRGKIWVDAKTFQVWREERELIVQTSEPVVLLNTIFVYQTSDYGILVPKNITLTSYDLNKRKGGNGFEAIKDSTVNFEYGKFRQANVEIKILDDDGN